MKKNLFILSDHYQGMSFLEFVAFIWHALFKNEKIFIYYKSLYDKQLNFVINSNSRSIKKGDLKELESERKRLINIPWEFQCDRYDKVIDFFIYLENGAIGHISWLYYKKDPNRLLRLGDEDCEIKFCLTLPTFRGKGFYPAVLQTIQCYLSNEGYQRCFICVNENNISSIRGIEKAGFLVVGQINFRKFFGFQLSQKYDTRSIRTI